MMRLNEIEAEVHRRMCEDDRFGYSWEERYGAIWEIWTIDGKDYRIRVGDYDCSSSTITAWAVALQHTPWEGALDGAITMHNMRSVFVGSGLFEWLGMSFLAEPGDLYLSEQNHVAMCQTQYPTFSPSLAGATTAPTAISAATRAAGRRPFTGTTITPGTAFCTS